MISPNGISFSFFVPQAHSGAAADPELHLWFLRENFRHLIAMVSFSCEVCNDTVIKKKLDQHTQRCRGAYFTCIDCSTTFGGTDYRTHTLCISEAEKYEKALYKGKKKSPVAQSKKAEPKKESKAEPKKESKKVKKESALDLSKYGSGSLYKIVKSIAKDSKKDKKEVLQSLQVKEENGKFVLTL